MASPTSYIPGLLNVPALLSGTGQRTIYTSPNGDLGTRIFLVKVTAQGSPGQLDLHIVEEGGAAAAGNLAYSQAVASSLAALEGMVLSEGDFISANPNTTNKYHVHIFGIEMS